MFWCEYLSVSGQIRQNHCDVAGVITADRLSTEVMTKYHTSWSVIEMWEASSSLTETGFFSSEGPPSPGRHPHLFIKRRDEHHSGNYTRPEGFLKSIRRRWQSPRTRYGSRLIRAKFIPHSRSGSVGEEKNSRKANKTRQRWSHIPAAHFLLCDAARCDSWACLLGFYHLMALKKNISSF